MPTPEQGDAERAIASLNSEFLRQVAAAITAAGGGSLMNMEVTPLGRGDVSLAYRVHAGQRDYFLKSHNATLPFMFDAEAAALTEIAATNTIRVPLPLCFGEADGRAYIVLEWLDLHPLDDASGVRMGRSLAALHRHAAAEFGWQRDNSIGATPQPNPGSSDWLDFWKVNRLGYQLKLAEERGYAGQLQSLGQRLLEKCDGLFSGYAPVPSLLHGDLWIGNVGSDAAGTPVIFDPASYYGDREADLAMTSLFSGFPESFAGAYEESWPVDEGYGLRRDFYNLYHLLNHLNLFGHGYLARTESTLRRLLASLES